MATALQTKNPLASDTTAPVAPLLPTLVVASFKGGVWKTSLAVALAERLALAGLKVLLITSDTQEDARARLGIKPSDPQIARVGRGEGLVTVMGARGALAIELLYRTGPGRFLGEAPIDTVVIDTPPTIKGGLLPGVTMVTPVDGTDAVRNLTTMLLDTPKNTEVILVKVHRSDKDEWEQNVNAIEIATKRKVKCLGDPLPLAKPILMAHNEGRSVWKLHRRSCTLEFLQGVELIAQYFWSKHFPKTPWPALPAQKNIPFVEGWDSDDEA